MKNNSEQNVIKAAQKKPEKKSERKLRTLRVLS
jgi:hypothetical protein